MRTQLSFALIVVIVFAGSIHADPAHAQRVFVAATGSDSNPCSFASPCRSFQHAHDVTSANGEIDVLDPAGYGAVTITKAISIQGHGFSGVSVPSGGTGITINAPATDAIHLNGLLIEGNKAGATGVQFNSGASLTMENCIVRNMTGDGLLFVSNATTAQTLAVSNSYFSDNGDAGMFIGANSSGTVTAAIERTGFYGNGGDGLFGNGAFGTGALTIAVTDSVAANNGLDGFFVQSTGPITKTNLSLTHALAEGNGTGIGVASATVWLAQSTVTGNSAGFVNFGILNSFQDNYFTSNGANSGSVTNAGKL